MTKEKKDLLVFGYGLSLISCIFAVGGLMQHGVGLPQIVQGVCAIVFVLVTVFRWEALRPGYRGWMKAVEPIGVIVSSVILAIVFFGLFAPIGLFFRLIRKDHLDRRGVRDVGSYWHKRDDASDDKGRYVQQF